MKSLSRIIFSISLLSYLSFSQTAEERKKLEDFAISKAKEWRTERIKAESLAVKLNIPIRKEYPDGHIIELQRFYNGIPMYYQTHNINAAKTVSTDKVWPGGSGGFSLTGSTDTLGVWDGGKVRNTHQELSGRVILSDGATTLSAHATHVSGTMIASGVVSAAKGMSHQGKLKSYDWNNDNSEMAAAAATGLKVSNHSYSYVTGWYTPGTGWHWYGDPNISSTEAYLFGFYSSIARDWDSIALNAPNYLIVIAAANDRLEGPTNQPVNHTHSGIGSYTCIHNLDGGPNGYDCISHMGTSKNILTVGAVNDIVNGYSQPSDVQLASFSSCGPTDDGRIKPDIVANGIALYSSSSTNNTSYTTYSGTSMASPNVSGSLGLLLQHQKNLHGNNPLRASTLKGLVIHTADEAGTNPGPDYQFG